MRIFRNSTAEYLLLISTAYGQLPYRVLTFLPLPYENVKDAFQKLCRAGYLEIVKAPGHKSFFITDAGYAAYCEAIRKSTKPQYWDEIPTSRNLPEMPRKPYGSAASTKHRCFSSSSVKHHTRLHWRSSARWRKKTPAARTA